MEATLKFNLDDPVDMQEHTHASRGYRYHLVINELINELISDYSPASASDVRNPISTQSSFAGYYVNRIASLASTHKLTEITARIRASVPGETIR